MAKQILKITNWVGGLNCATDPRDIKDSQFAQNWNMIDDRGGIVRKVGGAVDSIINLSHDNSNQQVGYGLHTMAVDYSFGEFDGTFDVAYEKGTVQAYADSAGDSPYSGNARIQLAASPTYISSADYDNDDYFDNWTIVITSGNGVGQTRTITDYTGSSKHAQLDAAFSTDPNTASTYEIFRWGSSGFGNSGNTDWISNEDGSGDWPDTDGNFEWEFGKYHLISKQTSITDHLSSSLGYVELKPSGDSPTTLSSLTIKPGVEYFLSFYAKASKQYYNYVADGAHCDRVPFVTLHSDTCADDAGTAKVHLFSNNSWTSGFEGTTNYQDNLVTNGDFETGTGTGGTDGGPDNWTRIGDDITCSYEGTNEYGGEGATLKLTADSNLVKDNQIITNAQDRTIATDGNWAILDPESTSFTFTEDFSTDDRLEITGTSSTEIQGAQLGTSYMTTLIAGQTYRVSASVYSSSGTISGFKFKLGGVATSAFDISTSTSPISHDITVTSDAALQIYYENASTTQWFIDDISVVAIDPSSFVYQDITCLESQYYNLNFVHSGDSAGIMYAVKDTTAAPDTYLIPWTTTASTGGLTTYKFLDETKDALNIAGKTDTQYAKFFVDEVSGGTTTRTIRIMFSCSTASDVCHVDGITVFKAWNDLATMSPLSTGISPYSPAITTWAKYSMRFKLPSTYTQTSDWVLRFHAGKAGWQDGASNSVNSHTVEFDNIRMYSEESDNLIFLNDNGSDNSQIKIYSDNKKQWEDNLINWNGAKSKPVYTNVNGVLKISDANFNTSNSNKLFFFNSRNIARKYKIFGYETRDYALCDNPTLTLTQALDGIYDSTVFPGIEYIHTLNSGKHYLDTNWDADNIDGRNGNQCLLMRYFQGGAEDFNHYGLALLDPAATDIENESSDSTHKNGYINGAYPNPQRHVKLVIRGNDGSANDMGSILSSAGDIAKVQYKFTYSVITGRWFRSNSYDNDMTADDCSGPIFKVKCAKLTDFVDAQHYIDGGAHTFASDTMQEHEYGRLDDEFDIKLKDNAIGSESVPGNEEDKWNDYYVCGESDRSFHVKKTVEGEFIFERGTIAKTDDIILWLEFDYETTPNNNHPWSWSFSFNTQLGHHNGNTRFEKLQFHDLNVFAYTSSFTESGDALIYSGPTEARVNWNFGAPDGTTSNNWEGRKFDVGISSVNKFGEENWINQGTLLNQGAANPQATTFRKVGEGSDGSSNITAGQAPTVTVYLGTGVLKDTFKKETKFYVKTNESDIWYLQFYINHDTGKIHSTTSGYTSEGLTSITQNTVQWEIPREDMVNLNQVNSYESEALLSKTYMNKDKAKMTCRYKAAVVANNKLYVGNILQDGQAMSDRMIVSPPNKYNILPDTNFIDVAINDGDEITALEFYKDKLLQFKKNKVFVINTSDDYEFLEDTFEDVGVQQQCQVTRTPYGIAWANESGCFVYDGKKMINLIDNKIAPTEDAAIISNNYWRISSSMIPFIGYLKDKKTLLIATKVSSESYSNPEGFLYNFITQSWSFLQRRLIDSGSQPHNGNKSNIQTDKDGNLIWYSKYSTTYSKIVKWDDAPQNNSDTPGSDTSYVYFRTKDFDFGQPGVRKKIYKVYVTYQCTDPGGSAADSKVLCKYAINGSSTFTAFSDTSTNYAAATGLTGSNGWTTAILKPSSSINNVYSFALQFGTAPYVPSGFEINDISIVYRAKRIK